MLKHIFTSIGAITVIKYASIIFAIIILALGYTKVLPPDSPIEEMAEQYLEKETGIEIKVNEK